MENFYFDGALSKKTLESYLSHAATAQWLYLSDTLEDDIRVIKRLGFKFLGRVSGIWKAEMSEEEHFRLSKRCADMVHEADSDIILQACLFEMVYREDTDNIEIPRFVFTAFGLEPEKRCFRFDDMVFAPNTADFHNGENAIPDISAIEARMWFYYRAANYINCGYEAFHMGQIHHYTANDKHLEGLRQTIELIRAYAAQNARRHKVLLDAHSHGLVIHGKSLLDYNAMPFTRYPVLDRPGEKLVLVREGKSDGGMSPDGWEDGCLPFLMEYDNWGGKDLWAHEYLTYEQRAWAQWWGYDQIAWFANQDKSSRDSFLEYTYKWTVINNPDAYFAFPLRRPLQSGERAGGYDFYKLNNKSDACPNGFSQEDSAEKLLNSDISALRRIANPPDILSYGAIKTEDAETGIRLPEKVVLYGSFQPYVGAVANDSNSEITRMYYIGSGTYSLSFIMPFAGTYDFSVSTWGTLSACYHNDDGLPRSGSGHMRSFTVEKDNTAVNIKYTFITNKITIELV